MTHDRKAEMLEALSMVRDLIQEAKGADGPNGGFVTDHLDTAESWLDKIDEALSAPPCRRTAVGDLEQRAREMCERLRATKTEHRVTMLFGGMIGIPDETETRKVSLNPNGPTAATLIEELLAALEARSALHGERREQP